MGRPMAEIWIPRFMHKFTDAGWEVVVSAADPPLSTEDFLSDAPGSTAIMANGSDVVSREVIEAAGDGLKVIARTGVGFDRVDVDAAAEHGVAVTTTPGSNGETVADFTLGLMLACSRLIPQLNSRLKGGKWDPRKGKDVFGKTLGIAGLGRIGQGVARRAAAFSMEILGYDPYVDAIAMATLGVRKVELADLLRPVGFHHPAHAGDRGDHRYDRRRRHRIDEAVGVFDQYRPRSVDRRTGFVGGAEIGPHRRSRVGRFCGGAS